jgi:hypothetical protein
MKNLLVILVAFCLCVSFGTSALAWDDDFSSTTFTGSDGSNQGTAMTTLGTTSFTNGDGSYGGSAYTTMGTTSYTNADGSYGGSSFTTEY